MVAASVWADPNLISIHALREESDHKWFKVKFTPNDISIHALREESDRPLLVPPAP